MNQKSVVILLADDDQEDCYLIGEALNESHIPHQLILVQDGEDLLDYLNRRGKYGGAENWVRPGLILLDLNMPRKDGREALEEIKRDPELRRIPIVVFTNSRAEEDILSCYNLGVSGFISKPANYMGLLNAVQTLSNYWLHVVSLPPA
jgi:CheY-like chemotaxis protein